MVQRLVCVFVIYSSAALPSYAGTLTFSGKVYSEGGGAPVANALVIPGVFAAGFNPFNYVEFYGDESLNLLPDAYEMAVADGNFQPAGSGVSTGVDGSFTWMGNTSLTPAQRLWFFVFEDGTTTSFFQVLATSDAAHWESPSVSGSTTLFAGEANQFVMGTSFLDGVAVTVIPFPEPTAAVMGLTSLAALACARRKSA